MIPENREGREAQQIFCSEFRKFVAVGHTAVIVCIHDPAIGKDFLFEFIKITAVLHPYIIIGAMKLCLLKEGLGPGRTGAGIAEFGYDFIFIHREVLLSGLPEILSHVSLIVVLLTDTDDDGAVFLFFFADNLVTGMSTLQGFLVVFYLAAVGFQNGVPA